MRVLFTAGVALLITSMTAAADEKAANLAGAWTGTSDSIVLGAGGHHPGSETLKDAPRMRHVDFTLTIKGEDGHRFWGTLKSADFEEPLVAILSDDGQNGVGADSDGIYWIRRIADDKLELCYAQPATSPTKSEVAACTVFTKATR